MRKYYLFKNGIPSPYSAIAICGKKIIDASKSTKNQSKTCSLLRAGFSLVNRIIHLSVERGARRVEQPYTSLSIDEKSFRKGHHFVSVLSCPQTRTVINVSEGRTKQVAKKNNYQFINRKPAAIVETVSMDMGRTYIHAVKDTLPGSHICFDKFHLVKYLNEAVGEVRRREVKKEETFIIPNDALDF